MYLEMLDSIRRTALKYREGLQTPCSAVELNEIQRQAAEILGYDLLVEHKTLLSLVNGLDWNGLVIYASQRTAIVGYTDRCIEGFVQANLDLREFEPMTDYVVFASDGSALYTKCISANQFQVILTVGLTVVEAFDTFEELIAEALNAHR